MKARVGSERVQQPELGLLQDCVNIDGDTKGLPESLLDGGGDDDHPKPSNGEGKGVSKCQSMKNPGIFWHFWAD